MYHIIIKNNKGVCLTNHYQRIRDLREDHGLEQQEIANLLSTTQQQISKYEMGTQKMSILHYIKLAKFYNVSLDYLAGITDIPKTLDGTKYTSKNITAINGNVNGGNVKININNK